MASVTGRIREITQPRGGYLPVEKLKVTEYEDGIELHRYETTQPQLVGIAVDYLTRVEMGDDPVAAFAVSLWGMKHILEAGIVPENFPQDIPQDLSDESIINAVIFSSFDVAMRAHISMYKDAILPDKDTIENIRVMVKRNVDFFNKVGPVTSSGFTFEGGYTDTVHVGDGDILTEDGLWDIKVLRGDVTIDYTLQLLMYWRMGVHSEWSHFDNIKTLGVYNPRKNTSYTIKTKDIGKSLINRIEKDVIGY